MVIRPGIELANLTDTGCVRSENEDYYGYVEPEADEDFLKRGRLAIVADGMGGHVGGRVASGIAVDVVRQTYLNEPCAEALDALLTAFGNAHFAIQEAGHEDPSLKGMGTTCSAAVLLDHQLHYGHVGDSRIYLLRDSTISQVTHDHSYVARLVESGALTPEEAAVHPERNVLTAALGMDSNIQADFSEAPLPLQANDMVLLCTDGLHGLVTDGEMLAVATDHPPREACKQLVEMAKNRGGYDNITVQIIRITE
ncbi:MAG: Stp1/IreP family PP2C-type Ser/Thr phosphatase [Acidobacteriota bacterium]|nr:Stp1/IreP family PP2C-type Ser/Thr phosphatase [Acidobacteriota bacterium]